MQQLNALKVLRRPYCLDAETGRITPRGNINPAPTADSNEYRVIIIATLSLVSWQS
jgi:hypothetical protein